MPVPTSWHPGEVAAQQARSFEDDVWGRWEGYQHGSPEWMTLFLTQLPFFSVTTLDVEGRPWCSLLTFDGRPGFIRPTNEDNHLQFTIKAPEGVPIRECLQRLHVRLTRGDQPFEENDNDIPKIDFCIGAVGVMMHNRRRNKLEGVITHIERAPLDPSDDVFVFTIRAFNTFGNCPKYINSRAIVPLRHSSDSVAGQYAVKSTLSTSQRKDDLPKKMLDIIAETDFIFLATKYSGNDSSSYTPDPPRLGNNHRGGRSGFLRSYWDEEKERRCVVLPDWSGNRMMMSFGNVTKDPVAGITVPVLSSDVSRPSSFLHLTGTAQVLANEEAASVMRGVRGALRLWIEDWTYVENGFPVAAITLETGVEWSPYNPPVRVLNREQNAALALNANSPTTRLVDVRFWSDDIATFVFEVHGDKQGTLASRYTPGQHVVVDAYDMLDTRVQLYSHMAHFRGGEKDLNDDGTRSWTISFAEPSTTSPWRFELTLRRKPRGGVTPSLFSQGRRLRELLDEGMEPPPAGRMKMNIMGIDGSGVLPVASPTDTTLRLAYLLSGIGLTPLLPHLAQLFSMRQKEADVLAVIATRNNEASVVQRILHHTLSRASAEGMLVRFTLFLLVSQSAKDDVEHVERASVEEELWQTLPSNVQVDVIVCDGQRLSVDSLSPSTSASNDARAFRLPSSYVDAVVHADCITVCAAPTFAKTAQKALASVGANENKVRVESFAF